MKTCFFSFSVVVGGLYWEGRNSKGPIHSLPIFETDSGRSICHLLWDGREMGAFFKEFAFIQMDRILGLEEVS